MLQGQTVAVSLRTRIVALDALDDPFTLQTQGDATLRLLQCYIAGRYYCVIMALVTSAYLAVHPETHIPLIRHAPFGREMRSPRLTCSDVEMFTEQGNGTNLEIAKA